MIRWPPGLGPERFLQDHWQKAPLFIPGALAGTGDLLSPEELAGLACEPDVESRLVSGDPEKGWQLRHGPFEESDFLSMPEAGWTLLVQDVEKHLPRLSALLQEFGFLPRWRMDDLMISYATPGGSVGPHVDAYDVFLVQIRGRRTWELDPAPPDVSHRTDSDLRVLAVFDPVQRHQVVPGDVLYLPPGVAHYGRSDEPGMTCSVGFRAPAAGELMAGAARLLAETGQLMYIDPDLAADEADGGRISRRSLDRTRRLLADAARESGSRLDELLGCLVTEGKPWLSPEPAGTVEDADTVMERLAAGDRLERHPGSRFAWMGGDGGCWLFADGRAWRLPTRAAPFCRHLADGLVLSHRLVHDGGQTCAEALSELLGDGRLAWREDQEPEGQ